MIEFIFVVLLLFCYETQRRSIKRGINDTKTGTPSLWINACDREDSDSHHSHSSHRPWRVHLSPFAYNLMYLQGSCILEPWGGTKRGRTIHSLQILRYMPLCDLSIHIRNWLFPCIACKWMILHIINIYLSKRIAIHLYLYLSWWSRRSYPQAMRM